ncbi:DNA adenine methylase [Candidatus Margulisiibacteriota bacterium]
MILHPSIELEVKLESTSKSHEKNRNDLRKIVLDFFVKEKAGKGNKEKTSKYKYIVEKLSSGKRVYLTRPVPLNKGFDFIIHVEDFVFMNGKDNPRHDDITSDLKNKKKKNKQKYLHLLKAIEAVCFCNDPEDVLAKYKKYLSSFKKGFSPELLLKVIKWLFIEQDIRYWNWSGRNMFMQKIKEI